MRVLNRDRGEIRRLSMGRKGTTQRHAMTCHRDSRPSHLRSALACALTALASLESASKLHSGRKAIGQTTYLRIWPTNTKWHPWTKTARLARVHTHSRPIFLSPAARSDDARWGNLGSARENDRREKEREREEGRKQKRPHARRDSAAYISASANRLAMKEVPLV